MNIELLTEDIRVALDAPPERAEAIKAVLMARVPMAVYDSTFLSEVAKARVALREKGYTPESLANYDRGTFITAAQRQAELAHYPVWQKKKTPEYWPLPVGDYTRGGAAHDLINACALLTIEAERSAFLASQNKGS